MEKICAILDCQGFNLSSGFIPREIAIVSDYISQCMELNTEINWKNLNIEDKKTVLFSTQEIHGLHFNPFNPSDNCFLYTSDQIGNIITTWYSMVASESKNLFAFKNVQLGEILKKLNIPSLNLDDPQFGFPSYDKIKEAFGDNYLCAYHKKPPKHKRLALNCAYRKANHLYRILTNEMNAITLE